MTLQFVKVGAASTMWARSTLVDVLQDLILGRLIQINDLEVDVLAGETQMVEDNGGCTLDLLRVQRIERVAVNDRSWEVHSGHR